jgi:hypothetical protein
MADKRKSGFFFQSRRILRKILKQYSIIPSWAGGLELTIRETLSLITLFTYVGVAIGVWQGNEAIHPYFLNNFFLFLFSIVPPFLLAGLLYYKFFIHAKQRYQQHQLFRIERSPMAKKLFEHDEVLKEICKKMSIDYKKTISRVGKTEKK